MNENCMDCGDAKGREIKSNTNVEYASYVLMLRLG